MLNLKMKRFGLRGFNHANYIKPINLISASILNIYLKREKWVGTSCLEFPNNWC
ncbi:hypothetical protein IMSAGC022_01275 [Alistipes sp.]|nr:hypothetical protein IMSAGC022_01275 [Alistipes sp.]